ncbi:MAG: TonB-dependent receptor plug [Segetibacter sp.]|nr:TonB-dependent receptor plug [Segetibacter sp.]
MKNSILPTQKIFFKSKFEKHRIKRLKLLLFSIFSFLSSVLVAQTTVNGKVTAADTALVGATVQVKGSGIATQTDAFGNFTISAPSNATLVITSVGFGAQEVKVGNRSSVSVQLQASAHQIDEVVVVGYGKQKRISLTGAVATASGADLNKRVVTNPAALLQGKLPGVSVIENSGEPGNEGVQLRVRGFTSFSAAGNDPFVIVDGIPGSLNAINPNDIESISVLKDAASASIYGTRAANGVILVTTKKGTQGRFNLEYSYNLGNTRPTKLLDLMTNSVEYMELYNKAAAHSRLPIPYPQTFIDQYRNPSDPVKYPNVDWQDILFRNVNTSNHYLSANGGRNGTSYNIGLGYIDQPGTMLGFDYKKYTLQFALNSVINRRITFGINVNFNYNDRMSPRQGANDQYLSTITQGPMYGPVLPDGSGRFTYRGDPYNFHNKNTVAIAATARRSDRSYFLQNNLSLSVKLLNNLTWDTRGGFTYNFSKFKDFRPVVPVYDWFTGAYASNLDVGGRGLIVGDANNINPIAYSQLTYEGKLKEHSVSVLGGVQTEYFKQESLTGYRRDFINNDLRELDAGAADGQTANGTASEWAMQSVYGRLNYDFNKKYLFEANMRFDGSSRFAEGNRWGFFPSLSAGWRLKQENFLQDINWLNDLKFRGSWGRLGNSNINLYPYQDIINTGANYPLDNSGNLSPGVVRTGLVDRNIKWETTEVFNIGVDVALFQNKLTFTADWFRKKTYDILRSAQIPGWIGLTAPVINAGTMVNKGYEFMAQYNSNIGQVKYSIGGNFQTFKNQLTKFGARQINNTVINEEGRPWGTFYLYDWIGIFQSQEEINKAPKHPNNPQPGDLMFRDVNNDGLINASDRTYFDGNFPDFNYSFNLNLNYKQFDFTAFFYGVEGQKNYVRQWGFDPFTQSTPPTTDWRNAWTPENKSTTKPAIYVAGYAPVSGSLSTYYLQDASFFRVKNVQVGYNVPETVARKAGMTSLRIYFAGDNLFLFTKYPYLDPERTPTISANFASYPQNKILSFGVRAKF